MRLADRRLSLLLASVSLLAACAPSAAVESAASRELVAAVEKSRGPYKVSAIAEAAALQVLESDMDWVRARVADVREFRTLLLEQLRTRGIEAFDSAANFVLLRVDDAAAWNRALRSRGVAVRPFPALPRLGDCLRVSIGPWTQVERFLEAFDEVRNA